MLFRSATKDELENTYPVAVQVSSGIYETRLNLIKRNNHRVACNLGMTPNEETHIFFACRGGIAYLSEDGFLGGLVKTDSTKKGVCKALQYERVKNGGYFLECFEGPLSKMYEKNGFKIVSRLDFVEEYAPHNWQNDSVLKDKPNVVFMSLQAAEVKKFEEYDLAYTYAKNTK